MEIEIGKEIELETINEEEIPEEEQLIWDDNDENLVATFSMSVKGQEELKRIARFMVDSFDEQWEAQEEMRNKEAKDWKTFLGELEKKDFPYENCANLNVPISFENLVRLAFRIYGEIFGNWSNPVGVLPIGPDDEQEAILKEKHTNYQVTEVIKDFPAQMFKALLVFLGPGDVTGHSYYDPIRKSNRHEILSRDEFVCSNSVNSLMPDYSDQPFTCRVRYYTKPQLHKMRGLWYGLDDILDKKGDYDDDRSDLPMRQVSVQVHGIEEPDTPSYSTHKILQWVGWMDMPGEIAPRYVQGYMHYETGKLLQLTIHEQAPWEELDRYKREQEELDQYRQSMRQYVSAFTMMSNAERNIIDNPLIDDADKMSMGVGVDNVPPMPMAPTWMRNPDDEKEEPRPMHKEPVYQFTHGMLIEPKDGTIGFGFGRLLADLNRGANTVLDQYVDAATVANVSELITTAEIDFEKPFKSRPGAIHKTKYSTGSDLRNNIMVLPKGSANPQMRELIDLLIKWGQSAPQAPDILSGMPGKSGETLGGIRRRSDHALKQLSTIAQKFSVFVTMIYKQNARLNAIFLDEKEFFSVNNRRLGVVENLEIGRAMYRDKFNVYFRSDMEFSTQDEKIARADELVQMYMTIPFLQANPAFGQKVVEKALEARDEHELAEMIRQAPPPMPPMPMGMPPGGGQMPQGGMNV